MREALLSTAYLPNIEYFSYVINNDVVRNDVVRIEAFEFYEKQSYRNRCEIFSANGILSLSIPLIRNGDKEIIKNKRISYAENWQIRHWRAITSAYRNAPYFEFFEDEFRPYFEEQHEFLLDFNTNLLKTILKILRVKKDITFTDSYRDPDERDLRNSMHPKIKSSAQFKPYRQVFSEKMPFVANLSMIDLLFNQGLNSLEYLAF